MKLITPPPSTDKISSLPAPGHGKPGLLAGTLEKCKKLIYQKANFTKLTLAKKLILVFDKIIK
ncbi:hypothetical protein LC605_31795 [Nostoc sp. CHAB 5836]|uniref:hypothetical protein n=1 Tax=Nostoc sp. CHAB 5836 TaxID=2780404 RepID=UPI001E34753F|nr:hypothetical protein [Nostoc sp. CHAB 5836]MCC5619553.1 hypothetical protein [Nostoc sp. CHAB 5836]